MIIVLGAPRTGTTSCAHALEMLNLSVLQYCPITRTDTKSDIQSILASSHSEYDAIVSSHFNESSVSQWIRTFPCATFIHCTRNEIDRTLSLDTLGYNAELSSAELYKCSVALINTGRYFNLDCDWTDELKWQSILKALNLEQNQQPAVDYPHSNLATTAKKLLRA